jgi:hypothetical protein
LNRITELRNIRTPQSWKEKLDKSLSREKQGRKPRLGKFPFMLAAVVTVAILVAGSALAYALTGGEFFAGIFMRKGENSAARNPYMDVSQLNEIAGTTIGTVVDTDELRIDVADVISSGSDAMVALKVTAKQLDSVFYDNGIEPLKNYRFDGETDGSLFQNMDYATIGYIYGDQDSSLADNQFYLMLTVKSLNGFEDGPYELVLGSFGYFDPETASGGGLGITAVYEGPWTFELNLSGDTEHSRTLFINERVDIGDYTYNLEEIYLTPFSCTAVISYEDATEDAQKRFSQIVDAAKDLSLLASDGTPVVTGELGAGSGTDENHWPDPTYQITLQFDVPVNVDDIARIHIFGGDYDVRAVLSHMQEPAEGVGEDEEDGPAYTTQWKNEDKYGLYDKMINSIDYYDYASGTFLFRQGDEDYNVSFKVNLLTGEAYEEVANEAGEIVQIEYSDGETLYLIDPVSHTLETSDSRRRGEPVSADERIAVDAAGNIEYAYREDGTNTVLASEYSLLPQGLAMKLLSSEKTWKFIGTGDMCGRDCVAVGGRTPEDHEQDIAGFEMMIDKETGVILQYLAWGESGDILCALGSLSFEDPGSFADEEESVKELISGMNSE